MEENEIFQFVSFDGRVVSSCNSHRFVFTQYDAVK